MTNSRRYSSAYTRQAERKTPFPKNLARLYVAVLILLTTPFFVPYLQQASLHTLALITLIVCVGLFAIVARMTPQGIVSASTVYLLTFYVFHFGAVIPLALGFIPSPELQLSLSRWFDRSYTHTATLLSLLGVFAFVIGVHVAFLLRKKDNPESEPNREYISRFLAITGFASLLSGIIVWFIVILTSRVGIFGSYLDYLDSTVILFGSYINYTYFVISLGFPLLVATPSSQLKTNGIVLFVGWAMIAIPMGLRGEVLFPVAIAVVVAARQRSLSISIKRASLIAITLLLLISVVRQIRVVGLSQYNTFAELRLNPGDALIEMGASLRPVTEVLAWEAAGEDYIMGSSYWAPVERLARRIIPGIPRIPAEQDERLMNVLVQKRVGTIGFSPIAEAYRNFGYIGAGFFMFLMGLVMGRLDRWPTNPVQDAYLVVIMLPFLIQIRNDFTPIPFQLLAGFLIVRFALVVGQHLRQFRGN
jgi:oligosaccharide repeat unit polymerase